MKSIFASKVFWFNALTVITGVATFFGYTPNQEIATKTTEFLFFVAPIVNIALRFKTKKAVSVSGK